jgi:hypothetical protein
MGGSRKSSTELLWGANGGGSGLSQKGLCIGGRLLEPILAPSVERTVRKDGRKVC